MTELEKIRRAKMYIDNLANGINPTSGLEVPDDTCLNDVRIARCFFFISEILGKAIDKNGVEYKKPRRSKRDFIVTDELLSALEPMNETVNISEFTKHINITTQQYELAKIPATAFTNWLLEKDLLSVSTSIYGKRIKTINDNSHKIGISDIEKNGMYGTYTIILYSPQAQQFLIDNFVEIVQRWKYK